MFSHYETVAGRIVGYTEHGFTVDAPDKVIPWLVPTTDVFFTHSEAFKRLQELEVARHARVCYPH